MAARRGLPGVRRSEALGASVCVGGVSSSIAPALPDSYWVGLLTEMLILGDAGDEPRHPARIHRASVARPRVASSASRPMPWRCCRRRTRGILGCVAGGDSRRRPAQRRVRPARLARQRRVFPDDHAGDRHGAVGPELPLDPGDRRGQRHSAAFRGSRRTPACRSRARSPSTTSRWRYSACRRCVMALLVRSPFGLTLRGIRENEVADEEPGLQHLAALLPELRRVRVHLPAWPGIMWAYYNGFVSPTYLDLTASSELFLMVTLGGPATLVGPGARRRRDRPAEERDQRLHRAMAADSRHRLHRHDPGGSTGSVEPGQTASRATAAQRHRGRVVPDCLCVCWRLGGS